MRGQNDLKKCIGRLRGFLKDGHVKERGFKENQEQNFFLLAIFDSHTTQNSRTKCVFIRVRGGGF